MKVLLINGSPKANGNTALALAEMAQVFQQEGIEAETIHIGNRDIRGCVACNGCAKKGSCVFDDAVNEVAPKFEAADGIVVGSPVYYAGPNATVTASLDRLCCSTSFDKTRKVGAAAVVCRRGGASAPVSLSGRPYCAFPRAMLFIRKAMFRASIRTVRMPSPSASASPGVMPWTLFQ